MKPTNVLFILSDEHSRRVLGCYGHKMIRTPNLDRLAARGVRFADAYTNSPICVPARASLATGRYPHQIRFWDNGIAYDGSVPTWHHRLRQAGHEVTSIGKLHFRSADDDNGFSQEIMPLHINDGIGDPLGWLRDPLPVRKATLRLAKDAGRGDSTYQDYDQKITDAAVDLAQGAGRGSGRQAVGVVRVAGLSAFPADRAAGVLRPLPGGSGAAAGAADAGRAGARPPLYRGLPRVPDLRERLCRRGQCPARHRRLFRPGQLYRPQCRAADGGAGGGRSRRQHPHPLFGRSRRQSRHPRAVGQIDDVRGSGRGADDRRRAGLAAGRRLPRAGVAGRCLPDDPGLDRGGAATRKTAACRDCRSTRSPAPLPSGRCLPSTMRPARRPAPS